MCSNKKKVAHPAGIITFGVTASDTANTGCDFAGFFGCYSTQATDGGRQTQSAIAGFESLRSRIDRAGYKNLATPIFPSLARISQPRWQPSFTPF